MIRFKRHSWTKEKSNGMKTDKRTGGGWLQTETDSYSRIQDKNDSTTVRAELFVTEGKKQDSLCETESDA